MKRPPIRYLISSPSGDVAVDEGRLDYPLEGDPLKTTYRDYFLAIADFILKKNFRTLLDSVNASLKTDYELSALNEIIIRTEKHGALYHPASIECITTDKRVKFGLNVAVTAAGKDSLQREFTTLKMLHSRFDLPYIPVPYVLHEMNSMVFLLEEWFDDYHEFHIARTGDDGQQVKLWEYGRGERFLTSEQDFEIYRQAARILTVYYDLRDFRLIYPWHHAAGDFVVKVEEAKYTPSPNPSPQGRGNKKKDFHRGREDNPSSLLPLDKGRMGGVTVPSPLEGEGKGEGYFRDKINVRLTTVRGYEPFMGFDEDDMVSPVLALFYFLLHLSMQMRLDKLDGVGESVWAADYCVEATVAGFFEGLKMKSDFIGCCGSIQSFLSLLRSFTEAEIRKTCAPIAEQFEQTKDYHLIQEHLEAHAERIHLTLQNSP